MERKDTRYDAGLRRSATPIRAAVVLLGTYIAMHLAVAGIIHILSSPDAFAAIAAVHSAPAAGSAATRPKVGAGDSAASRTLPWSSQRSDRSRACIPHAAIDSKCDAARSGWQPAP